LHYCESGDSQEEGWYFVGENLRSHFRSPSSRPKNFCVVQNTTSFFKMKKARDFGPCIRYSQIVFKKIDVRPLTLLDVRGQTFQKSKNPPLSWRDISINSPIPNKWVLFMRQLLGVAALFHLLICFFIKSFKSWIPRDPAFITSFIDELMKTIH